MQTQPVQPPIDTHAGFMPCSFGGAAVGHIHIQARRNHLLPSKKCDFFFLCEEPLHPCQTQSLNPQKQQVTLSHTHLLTGDLQAGVDSSYIFGCRRGVPTIHHVRLGILSFPVDHSDSQPQALSKRLCPAGEGLKEPREWLHLK